jgi:hypothetical protein
MGIPLGPAEGVAGSEISIDREFWYQHPLPNSVAPTFMSCNIARQYELEVRVGLGFGALTEGRVCKSITAC